MKRPQSNHRDPCGDKIKRRREGQGELEMTNLASECGALVSLLNDIGVVCQGDEDAVREELQEKIFELLQKRAQASTMCPSEAPRALHPSNWRHLMDITREVSRQLALNGRIEITQKGRVVDPGAPLQGPIRLRLASSKPPSTSGPQGAN